MKRVREKGKVSPITDREGPEVEVQGVIKNYRDLVSENYNLLLMAKNI
jgi:hypothetical protein